MLHSTVSGEKLKVTDILLTGRLTARQRLVLWPVEEMSVFRAATPVLAKQSGQGLRLSEH